jgi:superfamily II DNA/RNA helicase
MTLLKEFVFLDSTSTPATLEQNYIICELHQKISVLFSFLRSHLKKKSIVFFSSCKEVLIFLIVPFECICVGSLSLSCQISVRQIMTILRSARRQSCKD